MYNFSVPVLIQSIIVDCADGRTVAYEPVCQCFPERWCWIKCFIIERVVDSGFFSSGRYETMNHRDPYLVTVFGFMGIEISPLFISKT